MVAAVRVHKPGGPEVLTYDDVQIAAPGQGQIKIKQHAAGVNFIDAYFRMGMYPSPVGMPFIAGNESAGEVMAVGPGVTGGWNRRESAPSGRASPDLFASVGRRFRPAQSATAGCKRLGRSLDQLREGPVKPAGDSPAAAE